MHCSSPAFARFAKEQRWDAFNPHTHRRCRCAASRRCSSCLFRLMWRRYGMVGAQVQPNWPMWFQLMELSTFAYAGCAEIVCI